MTWLDQLAAELTARGVPARERGRILLELGDHIACEPECEDRLGDPRELAVSFADELATSRARAAALQAFAALALAAVVLVLSQLAIGHTGGYPGFSRGISLLLFAPAVIGMFIASQVALVAGALAALRAVRRRRAPRLPAAEIGLIRRRTRLGLLGGLGTVMGLELYVVDFAAVLPGWYLALVGGSAAIAGLALLAAFKSLAGARAIVSGCSGAAGDVYDDIPLIGSRWLRRRPWRLCALASLFVGLVMTLAEAHAERSIGEGIQRGVFEGLAAAVGFAVLGSAVGLASARADRPRPADTLRPAASPRVAAHAVGLGLTEGPRARLAADEDRSRAELVLRDSFAHGQIGLDELTVRVSAIHDAETIGQLRDALTGLLPPA